MPAVSPRATCAKDSNFSFHAGGLTSGGRDNGRPGLRADYGAGYYAAFLIDPDGYRIEAYFPEQA
jgi:hypothetical protein